MRKGEITVRRLTGFVMENMNSTRFILLPEN